MLICNSRQSGWEEDGHCHFWVCVVKVKAEEKEMKGGKRGVATGRGSLTAIRDKGERGG